MFIFKESQELMRLLIRRPHPETGSFVTNSKTLFRRIAREILHGRRVRLQDTSEKAALIVTVDGRRGPLKMDPQIVLSGPASQKKDARLRSGDPLRQLTSPFGVM
jgi:hypothetical protein